MFSARLVKGFKPTGEDTPAPKEICDECPGERNGAHLIGLTLFSGMKRNGLPYEEAAFSIRATALWRAQMNLSEDGKELEFRGFLGVSLLGKWRRGAVCPTTR